MRVTKFCDPRHLGFGTWWGGRLLHGQWDGTNDLALGVDVLNWLKDHAIALSGVFFVYLNTNLIPYAPRLGVEDELIPSLHRNLPKNISA
jgi:hypothetical protein